MDGHLLIVFMDLVFANSGPDEQPRTLLLSDGDGPNKLPASTGAVIWEGKMIVGGIHARGVLLCKNVKL